ncbi:MAG: ABC transporter permease [Oscillospiraceae bacterium]|jgi:peptide/nickel transport system permease protein|nr:ABC transporter permease [Oscillospiraceae bacterium]MCI1990640.1 ABC transporter permease [Oscillospiraceae bacterium]MCI2036305.1 ABC transporter permease [Oscillospiraceae bacterium]
MDKTQDTAAEISLSTQEFLEKPESQWKSMWDSLKKNKAAMVSLAFIIILVLIAVITAIFPQVLPHDPYEQNMTKTFLFPDGRYWFGTDQLGRDIFSRIMVGTRVSLSVGVIAVAVSMTLGVVFGSLAGYLGGKVDSFIMRIMDIMLSIPSILLAIAFMAALGQGIDKAVIAISLVSIPEYARIVRGEILSVKENDYVQAAKVIGDKDGRIIFRHILPNVLSSIIVRATLGISSAILDASALGFLGLGVQPPAAEWGDMLGRARNYIFQAPYTLIFPGLAISLTVLAFNLLGDGLRDALDPKSRQN